VGTYVGSSLSTPVMIGSDDEVEDDEDEVDVEDDVDEEDVEAAGVDRALTSGVELEDDVSDDDEVEVEDTAQSPDVPCNP
jgi:hypothetical protein